MSKILKFIKSLPFKIAHGVFEPGLSPAQLVIVALGVEVMKTGHFWWGLAAVFVGGVICHAIWERVILRIKFPLKEVPQND